MQRKQEGSDASSSIVFSSLYTHVCIVPKHALSYLARAKELHQSWAMYAVITLVKQSEYDFESYMLRHSIDDQVWMS